MSALPPRKVTPADVMRAAFDTHWEGGELERLSFEVEQLRNLCTAMLAQCTAKQLLSIVVVLRGEPSVYVGAYEEQPLTE